MHIPEHLQPFLLNLTEKLEGVLSDNLLGVYLHGSLTYGGYVKERSDIDLLILLNNGLTPDASKILDNLFVELAKTHPEEVKNIEVDMMLLSEIIKESEELHSQYTFMDNEPKGSETLDGFWIELSNVREHGIVLTGPEPSSVIPTISRDILIKANKQKFINLKKNAEKWENIDLSDQIYILVQASRVLYSLNNDLKLVSKQDSLTWAAENVPEQFMEMLQIAQSKLNDFDEPREQVISDNWRGYFKYVEDQFEN